jgi:hypothetical protein
MEEIYTIMAQWFQCPPPEIEVSKCHGFSATFSFRSGAPSYLRKIGSPLPEDDKIVNAQQPNHDTVIADDDSPENQRI